MANKKATARFGLEVIKVALREWVTPAAERVVEIKGAMLEQCVGVSLDSRLSGRIRYAESLEGLWYLRADVWTALAQNHGEMEASRRLDAITLMFGSAGQGMQGRDRSHARQASKGRASTEPQEPTDLMSLDGQSVSDTDFEPTRPSRR